MKKLYRRGTVHPSPPIITDQLAFLPVTILTLTAALTPEDREVLTYLISCSSSTSAHSPFIHLSGNPRSKANNKNGVTAKAIRAGAGAGFEVSGDHPSLFHCNCFRCYMSYWVRWDSSPNRQLIHEIIDAFEDWLSQSNNQGGGVKNSRKERRNKKGSHKREGQPPKGSEDSELIGSSTEKEELGGSESKGESIGHGDHASAEGEERGSVRRLVNYIGERIWGVWG